MSEEIIPQEIGRASMEIAPGLIIEVVNLDNGVRLITEDSAESFMNWLQQGNTIEARNGQNMKVPVWVGYCEHDNIVVAVAAMYSTPADLLDIESKFRIELVEGPVEMSPCEKCREAKGETE